MNLSIKVKKMIQIGYWPGFIVGMYPSQFAYKELKINHDNLFDDTKELNLYVHIPFCKNKCTFCSFFSIKCNNEDYYKNYINALCKQLEFYNERFKSRVTIKSICFGGGTPNAIPVELYQVFFDRLTKCNIEFDVSLEPSMEISPELISEEYLLKLYDVGIRRVSLGLQSLNEELRENINRKKIDFDKIMSLIKKCKLNMNIDVINGIPNQSEKDFMETLEKIVEYNPETISIYPLSGADNSLFKSDDKIMNTREKYNLFDKYYDFLKNNDYRCESHVKFVKKNQNSTHQQKIYEYTGVETLGIGCGARSYLKNIHFEMPTKNKGLNAINDYIENRTNNLMYLGYQMNTEENQRRAIIYGFFLGKLNIKTFYENFSVNLLEKFSNEFKALFDNNLIVLNDEIITLTHKGRKFTDLIGVIFWSDDIRKENNVI